ncbi:MAG TPA: hypothetical protein PKD74_00145 [Candidatus Dependentiae bacterium]|nr:hypothetical protein [Candidatus Dependentiae bacterium]
MDYKKCIRACLVVLICHVPVAQAFSLPSSLRNLYTVARSAVTQGVDRVRAYTHVTAPSLPQHSGKIAGVVAAVAATYLTCKALDHVALATSNVPLFYRWAQCQVKKHELIQKACDAYIRICGKSARLTAYLERKKAFVDEIKERLLNIQQRNRQDRVVYFNGIYQEAAQAAPNLGAYARGIHTLLGLTPRARHRDFMRARTVLERDYEKSGEINQDAVQTLKQLYFIGSTPFAWANYGAYLQDQDGVALQRLPSIAPSQLDPFLYRTQMVSSELNRLANA